MSRFNIAGLLGGIAELPSVINRGLLGPLPVNPNLGLDPNQVEQSRTQALNDMAFGMLATPRNQQGAGLALARQNATQGFNGRIFDMLKEDEYIRLKAERDKRQKQQDIVASTIPEGVSVNPAIWQNIDPSTREQVIGNVLSRAPGEQGELWRQLTDQEIAERGLSPDYDWQESNRGKLDTLGSRPPSMNVTNVMPTPTKPLPTDVQNDLTTSFSAMKDISQLRGALKDTGPIKGVWTWAQLRTGLGLSEEDAKNKAEASRAGLALAVQALIKGVPSNFDVQTALKAQASWLKPEGLNKVLVDRQEQLFKDLITAKIAFYKNTEYVVPPFIVNQAKQMGIDLDKIQPWDGVSDPFARVASKHPYIPSSDDTPAQRAAKLEIAKRMSQ